MTSVDRLGPRLRPQGGPGATEVALGAPKAAQRARRPLLHPLASWPWLPRLDSNDAAMAVATGLVLGSAATVVVVLVLGW